MEVAQECYRKFVYECPSAARKQYLTNTQRMLVRTITDQFPSGVTAQEIADLNGITKSGACNHLKALLSKGYLTRESQPGDICSYKYVYKSIFEPISEDDKRCTIL